VEKKYHCIIIHSRRENTAQNIIEMAPMVDNSKRDKGLGTKNINKTAHAKNVLREDSIIAQSVKTRIG